MVVDRTRCMNAVSQAHRSRLAARVLLVVAALVLSLGAMEIGVRLVLNHYLNPFEPDADVGYRLKANFRGRYPWVAVTTDANGFRVPAAGQSAPRTPILFVGDSVTFGFGVLAEESYPTQFGEQIGRPGDVLNAAVPGYNLEQVVRTIRRFIRTSGKPQLVVYGLCLNDIAGAQVMSQYQDIDPHAVRDGGILSSSMLYSVANRRIQRLTSRAPVDAPPDTKETLLRDFSWPQAREQLMSFDREWAELEALEREFDVPVVAIVLPFRQQVTDHPDWRAPQNYIREKCAESPIRCLDPEPVLRERRGDALYTPTSSMHFSPGGNRLLAEWLSTQLRDLTGTRPADADSSRQRSGETPSH
jgi:lysophospholipase L1-like esterase